MQARLIMPAIGLTVTSATEVVIFAIACMALNVLVGYTGLVSFGHGAWFGLAAYAAGLAQRNLFPDGFILPVLLAIGFIVVISGLFGMLILRRRGVYFSLLTLALSAMLYVIAFRWTALTGGEDGLGGITRPSYFGLSFDSRINYYILVAIVAFLVVWFLWRFHRSAVGQVLVAIRENETRARFVGYATQRYKLMAFVISASLTGLAGVLLAPIYSVHPAMGQEIITPAFVVCVIGGLGSFWGVVLAALLVGLVKGVITAIGYPQASTAAIYFLMLLVLLFRPRGLLGERIQRFE